MSIYFSVNTVWYDVCMLCDSTYCVCVYLCMGKCVLICVYFVQGYSDRLKRWILCVHIFGDCNGWSFNVRTSLKLFSVYLSLQHCPYEPAILRHCWSKLHVLNFSGVCVLISPENVALLCVLWQKNTEEYNCHILWR